MPGQLLTHYLHYSTPIKQHTFAKQNVLLIAWSSYHSDTMEDILYIVGHYECMRGLVCATVSTQEVWLLTR